MGNHHWKKIAAVMLAAAIGIQPVYVQAKTREEIQQEREQKKSEQQGTQSQYKQSQSKVIWPTPKQTLTNPGVALGMMVVSALVLWGFDTLAKLGVQTLIDLV